MHIAQAHLYETEPEKCVKSEDFIREKTNFLKPG